MISAHAQGILLSADEQIAILGPGWDLEWPAQTRQRYGDTVQWRQYAERSASRSPERWHVVAEAGTRPLPPSPPTATASVVALPPCSAATPTWHEP